IGLMATHPPLPERILAIDPSWSGGFEEAPEREAALAGIRAEEARHRAAARSSVSRAAAGGGRAASPGPALGMMAFSPERAVAEVGTISAANVVHAREIREAIPGALLDAAHDAATAPALI